jgi:diacylglycerol kinase (ATP)
MDTQRTRAVLGDEEARPFDMSNRWMAIVNPHAGGMRGRYLGPQFLELLGLEVSTIVHTVCRNDATTIAARACDYDGLVAVGGDGTVAEVLTGMNRHSQLLAVVPAGTGNCLAVELGFRSANAAMEAIRQGRSRRIDIMRAVLRHADGSTSRRCLASTAGMGYATEVALLAKRYFSHLRGHAYAAAAGFVRPRLREVQITSDGNEERNLQLTGLLINNTRYVGNARAFPAARIDDGLLDYFVFRCGWFKQCLHDLKMVTCIPVFGAPEPHQSRTVRVRFDTSETVVLDGDPFEQVTEMELVCQPSALSCRECMV